MLEIFSFTFCDLYWSDYFDEHYSRYSFCPYLYWFVMIKLQCMCISVTKGLALLDLSAFVDSEIFTIFAENIADEMIAKIKIFVYFINTNVLLSSYVHINNLRHALLDYACDVWTDTIEPKSSCFSPEFVFLYRICGCTNMNRLHNILWNCQT